MHHAKRPLEVVEVFENRKADDEIEGGIAVRQLVDAGSHERRGKAAPLEQGAHGLRFRVEVEPVERGNARSKGEEHGPRAIAHLEGALVGRPRQHPEPHVDALAEEPANQRTPVELDGIARPGLRQTVEHLAR